jgi:hypothetical protein
MQTQMIRGLFCWLEFDYNQSNSPLQRKANDTAQRCAVARINAAKSCLPRDAGPLREAIQEFVPRFRHLQVNE